MKFILSGEASWQQPGGFGLANRFRPAPGIQFAENIGSMGFYGIQGDEKPVGDLLIAETLCHEFEHVHFTRGDPEFIRHFLSAPGLNFG